MFLACAGLGSGAAFADAVVTRRGLELALAGLVISVLFAGAIPLAVEVALRRDMLDSAGMLAGIETQPAALAYVGDAPSATSGSTRPMRWCSPSP